MSHRENTMVESMKAAARNSLLDRRMGITEASQLPDRNDTMLSMGQGRQFLPSP